MRIHSNPNHGHTAPSAWKKGIFPFLASCLALCLSLALLPIGQAAESPPLEEDLATLVEWGILRGDADGQLHPERNLTRAEFTAMINRAYGYTESAAIPFKDVGEDKWYASDIAIAYKAGYFQGTSPTTAEPEKALTREETMVLLGRNMRLDTVDGEVTEFTDGHDFQNWSKGYVKAALNAGLLSGYAGGQFQPQSNITRGEMAQLLRTALGNLVSGEEPKSLGDVFGNVTISTPGTALKDTTIAGDLYISGGVGLGGVTLENVNVLGKIVVAGTGESEGGEDSIVLRNVEAEALVVNSLANQYTSVSAQGDTLIAQADVRTGAYLQDRTSSGLGFGTITLNGKAGTAFTVSGNLNEVVNKTPHSSLAVSLATVEKLTVDETATASTMDIDGNAVVKSLNLDTAAAVTGTGDVQSLTVNTAGSNVAMGADQITIRPGVESTIAGQLMNAVTAAESSMDPRFLAGYPQVEDVAPTNAQAVFATNKAATVYWAVSSVTDGSIREEELISPKSYGSKALRSGNFKMTSSNKEQAVRLTGLTAGGTYYLSAIMVDSRGVHSPVKVVSFTTPDDTTPAFTSGYPYMSRITNKAGQVAVMTNKTCRLYYALLPKGSMAPTTNDFRTAAVEGNLGYGVVAMTKNVPDLFYVNNQDLQEKVGYDLYLWLTDNDGAKSSTVRKLNFTTVDKTPPVFQTELTNNKIAATSLGFLCNVNENSTVYWVIVKADTKYPLPRAGQSLSPALDSDYAKLQVANGMNAFKSGKVNAKANIDVNFTISGLKAETAYDIYYLAKDTAGNYSAVVKTLLNVSTLDNIPPKATQEFTRYEGDAVNEPYPNTDIRLVFSENVQRSSTADRDVFLKLYQDVEQAIRAGDFSGEREARNKLADALRNTVKLYDATKSGTPVQAVERTEAGQETWLVDYRYVTVARGEGEDSNQLILTFPTDNRHDAADPQNVGAINLNSGSTYYFRLEDIADTSAARNKMGATNLPRFTTIAAQVYLEDMEQFGKTLAGVGVPADAVFALNPEATAKVDPSIGWDMLIWSDTSISFNLYRRVRVGEGETATYPEGEGWTQVGTTQSITVTGDKPVGDSLTWNFYPEDARTFEPLRALSEDKFYEYAISLTKLGSSPDRSTWSRTVNLKISIMSGGSAGLMSLATNVTEDNYKAETATSISDISVPVGFRMRCPFMDTAAPYFVDTMPRLEPTDSTVTMTVMLNRPGTVYYVLAPVDGQPTRNESDDSIVDVPNPAPTITTRDIETEEDVAYLEVPVSGDKNAQLNNNVKVPLKLSTPGYLNVTSPNYSNPRIKSGSMAVGDGAVPITVEGLEPDKPYYAYFVLKGAGQVYSETMVYRFVTAKVTRPVLILDLANPVVNISTDLNASVKYMLITYNNRMNSLLTKKFDSILTAESRDLLKSRHPQDYEDYLKDDYTVLQALIGSEYEKGEDAGSIFDYYAPESYKEQVATYIRASNPDASGIGIIATGNATVPDNGMVPVNCGNMPLSDGAQYVFLAVGKSTLGSGDAFRAILPVSKVDSEAPKIINVGSNLIVTEDGLLEGEVTLNFDETLYYNDTSTSPATTRRVDLGALLVEDRNKEYISVVNLKSSSSSTVSLVTDPNGMPAQNQSTEVIVIKVAEGTRSGSSISFKTNLCDQFSNVRPQPLVVTFNIIEETVGEGETATTIKKPEVTIKPSAWDATAE